MSRKRASQRTPAEDELRVVVRRGFWRLRADQCPNLVALTHRTFGDEPTTSALRRRLRRGFLTFAPAFQDAAFTLFGVTDETADLNLGVRQEQAGQTPGLPAFQAPSTVRGEGGLEEFLLARILSYFEEDVTYPDIDPSQGRGYSNTAYEARCITSPGYWEFDVQFTVSAYRPDIEIVTTALHGRAATVESADVISKGHHKIGAVPVKPTFDNSALMLA